MIVRPRANMFSKDQLLPQDFDCNSRTQLRNYALSVQHLVANVLEQHGMPCSVFDMDGQEAPDYTMLLSRRSISSITSVSLLPIS